MIDIDAEFRKAFGSANTSSVAQPDPGPLTMHKMRQAMAKAGPPERLAVAPETDLQKRLSLRDAGDFITSDFLGGQRSIAGIEVKTDQRIPVDVVVCERAGKLVKVIALTDEAKGAASAYAAFRERAEKFGMRGLGDIGP